MELDDVKVDPGSEATTKVTVRNLGTRVEEFELIAQGPGAVFASVIPATLAIYPDLEQRAVVRFTPPRSPHSPAGLSTFEVVARSVVHSDVSDVARGRLTVSAFEDLQAGLKPDVSRGRKPVRHVVSVTNGGNTPMSSQVAFADQDKVLTFEPQDKAVTLQPGGTAEVPVLLNGPRRWFGRTERLPFAAVVTPAGTQPPITLNGTRQQTPVFPWWMPPAALVIVALAVAIAALIHSLLGPAKVPSIGQVDQAIAVKQLTDAGYLPQPIPQGDDNVPKGQAIKTDPAPNAELAKGQPVKLYVSSGPCGGGPCPVEVPIVEGLPVSEAQARLETAKLTVQLNRLPSDTVPFDRVISANPPTGTKLQPGKPVQLTVSLGPPHNPAEQAAADKAAADKAAADKAAADKAAADKAAADKAAADKAAADKAAADKAAAAAAAGAAGGAAAGGSTASKQIAVPALKNSTVEAATATLEKLGLKTKTAPPVHSNAVLDGKVLSTTPEAAAKADPGSDVTLIVAQNTVPVNLIDSANNPEKATWTATGTALEKLAFGGTPSTTGSLVNQRFGSLDSSTPASTAVLETHPPDKGGLITGVYQLQPSVVPGDHVKALVGLLNTSGTTDDPADKNEVTFAVEVNGQTLKSVTAKPGTPQKLDADLSQAKDATSLKIIVTSKGQQDKDLTPVWQGLRLEPTIGR